MQASKPKNFLLVHRKIILYRTLEMRIRNTSKRNFHTSDTREEAFL